MKTAIFDKTGKEIKQIELPKEIFGVAMNSDLIHSVLMAMASNSRANTAHVKDRSEVSGGGRKPWRQKGTGRARHGSIRSPIWRTGGVSHGPRNERNYDRKINKKVRARVLSIILSQKARDGEIVLIDSLNLDEVKTKSAVKIISALAKKSGMKTIMTKKNNAALIALSERENKTEKSFRNIKNIRLDLVKNMNVIDLMNYKFLVIENPEKAFKILSVRVSLTSNS